uniref:Secreted protein n=1 Tax=Glossina pallidipes TaxID=7398 RepID=A0A1B0A9K1_GLOPL
MVSTYTLVVATALHGLLGVSFFNEQRTDQCSTAPAHRLGPVHFSATLCPHAIDKVDCGRNYFRYINRRVWRFSLRDAKMKSLQPDNLANISRDEFNGRPRKNIRLMDK